MIDSTLTLISYTKTQNQYGAWVDGPEEKREILCQYESVTRAEFFEGGRNGLNPAFVFVVFADDYRGEEVCKFGDQTYSIYRTYRTDDDYMELYVERKGGTNGKAD